MGYSEIHFLLLFLWWCLLAVLNWLLIIFMYCIFIYFTKKFCISYISFLLCWSPTSTSLLHSVGHAMIQTVKHWPTTSGATIWSQASLWDLCWKEWHWDRFFSKFNFIQSLSFYQCSILYSCFINIPLLLQILCSWQHLKIKDMHSIGLA